VDPALNRRFPSIHEMERAAARRVPAFVHDYVVGGIGRGQGLRRNRAALDAVSLMPRYLAASVDLPDPSTTLFGETYSAAYGVAPVGNGGSVWPDCADHLAAEARARGQPFCVSTVAVGSLEHLRGQAGALGWFQLYRPNVAEIEEDVLRRAKAAGYRVLMVTVDVPGPLRRDHDLKNNFGADFSLLDPSALWAMTKTPRWTLAMAPRGFPRFETLLPYTDAKASMPDRVREMLGLITGHVTVPALERLRGLWDGPLLAKGILDPQEALICKQIGLDGIVLSNHGGRQLEAAPSAAETLPETRALCGPDFPILADGGVRTGLDICRMLALGADMVLLGRAFYLGMGALGHLGRAGASHVFDVLTAEMVGTMRQLGAATVPELRDLVIRESLGTP
jgi:isopentenyl diphosphate isomerase/L-lactate dehydrogenase-like FMN-dependent dehydrogenase